jgi:hypothetical protein
MSKSYPVRPECDFAMWAEIAERDKDRNGYYTKRILRTENLQEKINLCLKWKDYYMTLSEAEEHIGEFGAFEFNGEEIIVLNNDM